jgi:uncharacterized protein HemY
MLNRRNQTIPSLIAEATILKKRGFYAAAKHLLKQKLAQNPHHEALQVLYRRIEMQQQVKIDRRHR